MNLQEPRREREEFWVFIVITGEHLTYKLRAMGSRLVDRVLFRAQSWPKDYTIKSSLDSYTLYTWDSRVYSF